MTVGRVIDISSNNHPGNAGITWAKVKGDGVTTALIKATQGTTYVNPWFGPDTSGARAVGIDTLAYHYADWTTPKAEAAFFVKIAGSLAKMLDGEGTEKVAWSNDFLAAIQPTPTERLYYGGASALSNIGPQIRARLMVAEYPASGAPTVGYPGYGVLWQYTDKAQVPGITGPVDESKWYGTESQYDLLFSIPAPPSPPPQEETMPLYVTNSAGTGFIVASDLSSKTGVVSGADAAVLQQTGLYTILAPGKLSDEQINAIPNAT